MECDEQRVTRVVAIGGGHGLYQMLLGLKQLPNVAITGITGNTDFGGTTRKAVECYDGPRCLGDVTLGISALADARWASALDVRLRGGDWDRLTLRHVMLLSLLKQYNGSLDRALEAMCDWCGTGLHRMITITSDRVDLRTTCVQVGIKNQLQLFELMHEGQLDALMDDPRAATLRVKTLSLSGKAMIAAQADRAIRAADIIVIAPGSFHGSILATLLPDGVKDAFVAPRDADGAPVPVIFFLNIFKTPGDPSYGYDAADFVNELQGKIGRSVNYVACCTSKGSEAIFKKVRRERVSYAAFHREEKECGFSRVQKFPFAMLSEKGDIVHNPDAVAACCREFFEKLLVPPSVSAVVGV